MVCMKSVNLTKLDAFVDTKNLWVGDQALHFSLVNIAIILLWSIKAGVTALLHLAQQMIHLKLG